MSPHSPPIHPTTAPQRTGEKGWPSEGGGDDPALSLFPAVSTVLFVAGGRGGPTVVVNQTEAEFDDADRRPVSPHPPPPNA